ncbi:MAG: antibiotic biosynthesis monooxygenase [Dehalococcoidia bacterium]|nr:antibiotic biosynthesis monooxygenase [Dehalococcoidia bacterium]MCA9845714.1 antibiotic biosynthesis monooxygenase [Dehalococcoidia bacterium]MCA9854528.1 antibiotic biosynthesis monooxygenase [Dehalococcoidia bacterium]
MPYIRISIARPRPGQEKRLAELQQAIADYSAKQPGCDRSYVLRPHDHSGEIARISIWDNESQAEAAANSDHMLSLRSELNLAAAEGGHSERAFSDQ